MSVDMGAVQTYLYQRLVARNVAAGRVYEDVPFSVTTAAGPYVEFSDSMDLNADTSVSDGIEHLLTLNIWDEQPSMLPVKAIAQQIRAALHKFTFGVAEADCISFFDSAQFFKPDDNTRQGVVRLRILCRT